MNVSSYLRSTQTCLLQIGGGRHLLRGWLNGDIIAGDIYLNARQKLPLANESFDRVFAEHFIEHIQFRDAEVLFSELHRVLKPGGRIRFATPDLEKIVALYEDRNPHVSLRKAMDRHEVNHSRQLPSRAHFLNDLFRLWGHRFIYDFETLEKTLHTSGFTQVQRQSFGDSNDPLFKNLERHADVEWMKEGFQLIIESSKPEAGSS